MKRLEEFNWNKIIHDNYQTYLIRTHHIWPYLVAIKDKNAIIYRINPKIYLSHKEKYINIIIII